MSHEIMQTENGQFAMAYREGDPVPWHAGETNPQTFVAGASPAEIMQAARLDYTVGVYANHRPNGQPIPDSFHIAMEGEPFTVLGRYVAGHWKPVQNESLVALGHKIEVEHGFQIATAGALFGGSKIFLLLESPESMSFMLPGNDRVKNYLLCTVSHLGIEANKFISCDTRVVCENTVQAALSEGGGIITHDHRVDFDPEVISTAIGLNAESFGEFADIAQRMAEKALSDVEALEYFRAVLGGKEKELDSGVLLPSVGVRRAVAFHKGKEFVPVGASDIGDVESYVADRLQAAALPADVVTAPVVDINPGHDLPSTRGTLWGAFNTLTWQADHAPTKNRGVDANLASNLLGEGTGGKTKKKALTEAVKILEAA